MITAKSSVQAVDPASGIWFVGKVTEEHEDAFNIRWANCRVSNWVAKDKVRFPVPKRQCRIDSNDWPRSQPSLLQKGEDICVKKADGTSGECITVGENDPFNCVIHVNNRRIKYEWLREVRLERPRPRNREPSAVLVVNQADVPRNNSQATTSDDASRQPNTGENREKETPRRRPAPKKRRATENASSGARRAKKTATRIAMGPAADADDGGPPQEYGMATGLADAATLALYSVVTAATAEGYPPPLPEEWSRATPAFGCSAVCDGRFAGFNLKLKEQSEELAQLRKRVDELELKLESVHAPSTASSSSGP